jgi:hypothetical protein
MPRRGSFANCLFLCPPLTPHCVPRSATSCGVTSIGPLPPAVAAASVAYLSGNDLADLSGIQQFRMLRVLSLANNQIACPDDLAPLADCPHLEARILRGAS